MKSAIFLFLLFACCGSALSAGISPAVVELDRSGKGAFWILNPHDQDLGYTLHSTADLSRTQGIIRAQDRVRITAQSPEDAQVIAEFESEELPVQAQLSLALRSYNAPVSEGLFVSGLVIVLGLLLCVLIYFFLISSGLRLR